MSAATATHIEKKTATAAAGLDDLYITGGVTQLNTVLKIFLISEIMIAYSNATLDSFNNGLVNGMMVRIEGVFAGSTMTTTKEVESADLSTAAREGFSVDREGIITTYDSARATFKANGMSVKASAARMSSNLVDQARVKVSGVRCQVSGVRCQVSGVRCQVSGVRCQVSGVRCQVSLSTAC